MVNSDIPTFIGLSSNVSKSPGYVTSSEVTSYVTLFGDTSDGAICEHIYQGGSGNEVRDHSQ